MPLIALDILEGKIKELTLVVNRLREENDTLREKISSSASGNEGPGGPEAAYEPEKLKKQLDKYKQERAELYTRIASAVKKLDSMTEKSENG